MAEKEIWEGVTETQVLWQFLPGQLPLMYSVPTATLENTEFLLGCDQGVHCFRNRWKSLPQKRKAGADIEH